ncbi:MAG: hypothetical protein NC339_03860 [Muribaculaceae bacterium]|nr:hypothetical protein [Muribaculaceae bacterium]
MPKSKYDGLPWMGGKERVEPKPEVYGIDFDDDRYDQLKEKLEDLESRLDDFAGTDYYFDESLGKVSELMDREHLSEDDLDLIERALDNVESRMDDCEDHLDMEDDELDDRDSDLYDDDIEDELDDALLDDDRFDDYNYRFGDDPDDDF